MAASVAIQEGTGASVSWATITQARLCTRDSSSPGDYDPCVVPATGYYYSYWKHHSLYMTGSFAKITNIRVFSSGAMKTNWELGTGGMVLIAVRDPAPHTAANGCPVGSYQQAAGTQGTTGYYIGDVTNGHGYYKAQTVKTVDFDSYTSTTPLLIDSSEYTTTASRSYSWVLQAKLATNAVQGDKPNEIVVCRYDEY
jgi:hypothetical protein